MYVNRRNDNHREDLSRYHVSRFTDLRDVIVPFFRVRPLRTSKRESFERLARIVELMDRHKHLTARGVIEIASIAEPMSQRKPSEVLRILRDHTPTLSPSRGETKRWSGPCGDAGRSAEMSDPPIAPVQKR